MIDIDEIERLAKAANYEVFRSSGWDGTVEMGDHLAKDEAFMKVASPIAILELTTEIRKLREAVKTPLMTRIYRNAWHSNGFEGLIDARVVEEAFADGAEKVLVYYGEARIFTTLAEFMEAYPK